LDTADTLAFLGSDLDVAVVTPRGTPGVSNDVVVLARLRVGSIANSGDGVVEVSSALSRVHDTTSVHLEDRLVGLDGDGDWLLSNSSLELFNGLRLNVSVGRDLSNNGHSLGLASGNSALARGVWVLRLGFNTVLFEVLEGLVLPTTLAAEAGLVARDKLLLREGLELAVGDLVNTFSSSDS